MGPHSHGGLQWGFPPGDFFLTPLPKIVKISPRACLFLKSPRILWNTRRHGVTFRFPGCLSDYLYSSWVNRAVIVSRMILKPMIRRGYLPWIFRTARKVSCCGLYDPPDTIQLPGAFLSRQDSEGSVMEKIVPFSSEVSKPTLPPRYRSPNIFML